MQRCGPAALPGRALSCASENGKQGSTTEAEHQLREDLEHRIAPGGAVWTLSARERSSSHPSRSNTSPCRRDHSRHSDEEGCHPAECCSLLPAHQGPEQQWALEHWVPVCTSPPELHSPLAAKCPVCPRRCKNRIALLRDLHLTCISFSS